jgi:biotin transport system substrate-specific component
MKEIAVTETTAAVPSAPVMSELFWRRSGLARSVILAVAGSVLLAVSAKVQVPFWPVPMTMQSLVVLMIGVAYGSRLGAATVALYLAEGAAGLPVFAGAGAGAAYMAGPTGGYLLGFVLAAALTGWLAERGWDRSIGRAAVTLSLGHVLLFVPGVLWLAVLFGWTKAIAFGLTPFIAATVVKTAIGVALVGAFWSAQRRRSSAEG